MGAKGTNMDAPPPTPFHHSHLCIQLVQYTLTLCHIIYTLIILPVVDSITIKKQYVIKENKKNIAAYLQITKYFEMYVVVLKKYVTLHYKHTHFSLDRGIHIDTEEEEEG